MAPEYFMHGIINEKTDVFAFGVLLLELITGRRAVDSSRQSLVIWVWGSPISWSFHFFCFKRIKNIKKKTLIARQNHCWRRIR